MSRKASGSMFREEKAMGKSYVASLDVGTTTIRCVILNSSTEIVGSSRAPVKLHYPQPGFVEINPAELWETILEVVKNAVADAGVEYRDIQCLGISTQRSSFVTWDRQTGTPFHNFITWKDIRAKDICNEINSSIFIKSFRFAVYGLYCLTFNERFLAGSRLKIASNHVTGRLLWAIRNCPQLKNAIATNSALFGTVDTWLLYKLTKGSLHVTDVSNASATGFYDPFVLEWGAWCKILRIPEHILPKVVDNDFNFGATHEDIFGHSIPIRCVMADQSSSMFASGCFECNDLKVTMGTGAFLDVNTGDKIHTSVTGIYPLIGWKIHGKIAYIGEVACNDCGSLVEWLLSLGLITNPSESFEVASKVENSDGVCFIPAFSGLGPPINDDTASSGFMGIKASTTRNHLVRAVLEGIANRCTLAFQTLKMERNRKYKRLIVDGGVSQNDFICQMLADLTGMKVDRLESVEMSVLGVGFLAGISAGIWKDVNEVASSNKISKAFIPNCDNAVIARRTTEFNTWTEALQRFKTWYKD